MQRWISASFRCRAACGAVRARQLSQAVPRATSQAPQGPQAASPGAVAGLRAAQQGPQEAFQGSQDTPQGPQEAFQGSQDTPQGPQQEAASPGAVAGLKRHGFQVPAAQQAPQDPQDTPQDPWTTPQEKCASCGIQLQAEDPHAVGFFTRPKSRAPDGAGRRTTALGFLVAYSRLDEEEKEAFTTLLPGSQAGERTKQHSLKCKRCHDALYQSVYDEQQHQPLSVAQLMKRVPRGAPLVHVASFQDFPLSLINFRALPQYGQHQLVHVVNKANLFFSTQAGVSGAIEYIGALATRLVGDTPVLTSAQSGWGLNALAKKLPARAHLVGYVNSGKTSLANALLQKCRGQSRLKNAEASALPAFTRDFIKYDLSRDQSFYDVPGFLPEHNVFRVLKPDAIKHIVKGKKSPAHQIRKCQYESVGRGHVFTNGGLFFLVPPPDVVVQVTSFSGAPNSVFKDLHKAVQVCRDPPAALQNRLVVKPAAMDSLVRYVVPPFHGVVDLVVKDVGFFQLKPTSKMTDQLFEVWAPRGVVLGIREPIGKYLARSLTKKDARQRQKSFREPLPTGKMFSRLYEVPADCTDVKKEMQAQFDALTSTCNSWNNYSQEDFEEKKFWIEKVY